MTTPFPERNPVAAPDRVCGFLTHGPRKVANMLKTMHAGAVDKGLPLNFRPCIGCLSYSWTGQGVRHNYSDTTTCLMESPHSLSIWIAVFLERRESAEKGAFENEVRSKELISTETKRQHQYRRIDTIAMKAFITISQETVSSPLNGWWVEESLLQSMGVTTSGLEWCLCRPYRNCKIRCASPYCR